MQQLISQIVQALGAILLAFLDALKDNLLVQIITALWVIIGGTWEERRNKLRDDVGELITHPLYYDPKTYDPQTNRAILYPFDAFQEIRIGFAWFAGQLTNLSDGIWPKVQQANSGLVEKGIEGLILLGFFYSDIVIGFAIAYENGLVSTIPPQFNYYGIAVAFATIGAAFAAGLVGFEILRGTVLLSKNRIARIVILIFSGVLFVLSLATAVGINLRFIVPLVPNLSPVVVSNVDLISAFSLQVLTRVNALIATLLLPLGGALEGIAIAISFVLGVILGISSLIIRVIGTIVIVIIDLSIRFAIAILVILVFLIFAAPERLSTILTRKQKTPS